MNLTGLSIRCGDSLLADNHYTYDGNGNRLEKQQLSGTTRYVYDALNQLVKAEYPTYGEELFYDRAGNRTRRRSAGVEEVYAYDAGNHLTKLTRNGEDISFQYDRAGNLVKDDKVEYSYDAFNRQTAVETFDGNIQINHYDAEGLRHEMEENGKLVQFIFNSAKEVVTETEDRTVLRYIRGSELIARNTDAVRTYYHYASDEMGSITHVTDEDGNILNRYEYDAWGNLTLEDEQVSNRFKYTGEQFDPVTQQYYLRARFYNPALARFMQEDTFRRDGLNLYAYCANNPVRYVDPSGHDKSGKKNDIQNQSDGDGINKTSSELNTNGSEILLLPGPVITGQNRLPGPVADGPSDGSSKTTSTQLSRRELAERKLADAANGSRAEGVLIGKDGDVPVHQSQQQLKKSIMDAGAQYIGPTRNNDGQIYHMKTPYGPVEIRIMQQKPGQTNSYLDNRTIIVEQGSVGNGTGVYTYGNGAPIRGSISKSDRKAIGHTHGQTP